MSQPNFFSTKGAQKVIQESPWVDHSQVVKGRIIAVEAGESSKRKSPFVQIVIDAPELADLSQKQDKYGTSKPICKTDCYYYSSEKAAQFSTKRLANFRDALKVDIDSLVVGEASSVKEQCVLWAAALEGALKGKEGYFIIGGREGTDGRVYAQIHNVDFVHPASPEGKAAAKTVFDKEQMQKRLVQKNTMPSQAGSSTSAPDTTPAPEVQGDFENF